MKTYTEFLSESKINEEAGEYKILMTMDGRKSQGARSSKITFSSVDSEDFVTDLTFKQFKASKLPYKSQPSVEKKVVAGLASKLTSFGKKVDFNKFVRSNEDFMDQIEELIKMGVKVTKSGVSV